MESGPKTERVLTKAGPPSCGMTAVWAEVGSVVHPVCNRAIVPESANMAANLPLSDHRICNLLELLPRNFSTPGWPAGAVRPSSPEGTVEEVHSWCRRRVNVGCTHTMTSLGKRLGPICDTEGPICDKGGDRQLGLSQISNYWWNLDLVESGSRGPARDRLSWCPCQGRASSPSTSCP